MPDSRPATTAPIATTLPRTRPVAVVVGPHIADTSTSLRDVLVPSLESSDDIAGYGGEQSG